MEMSRFDMFKMGFWGGLGRTTGRIVCITIAGKIILHFACKSVKEGGNNLVESFFSGVVDKIDNLDESELEKLKDVTAKLSEKPKEKEDEEK